MIVGFLSAYTCWLIVKHSFARNLDDIIELVEKMWGRAGKNITLVFSCAVLLGAGMAYNVLMNSAFFNIMNGISIWSSGEEIGKFGDWGSFSDRYTPFLLYALLASLLTFREEYLHQTQFIRAPICTDNQFFYHRHRTSRFSYKHFYN